MVPNANRLSGSKVSVPTSGSVPIDRLSGIPVVDMSYVPAVDDCMPLYACDASDDAKFG